ncbi:MAG TPA: C-terminal binding protein [Terriglobales bacterium]|nr:C-terminal binding protein [Terriglobales bacterium]
MPDPVIAVSDSVFPDLNPARMVLSGIAAKLRMAEQNTPAAILQVAAEADGVLVTYAQITAAMIQQMSRCRIIARFGIGVDNVDVAAASKAGIVVTRVPDYCIEEVADHAMALLLALARKVPLANALTHAGRWELAVLTPIHRLRGRTLGLVGFGRIPQAVVPRAKQFGLHVVSHDPFVAGETMAKAGVEKVEFAALLKNSDFISIHAPLTPETTQLFNAAAFAQMKATAYLINTARGPIVDEIALARALDGEQLAGAALDVLSHEPPVDSPLLRRENVILTPHMSFYSVESLVDLQTKAAEEVVRVMRGEMPLHAVNPEVLSSRRERHAMVDG